MGWNNGKREKYGRSKTKVQYEYGYVIEKVVKVKVKFNVMGTLVTGPAVVRVMEAEVRKRHGVREGTPKPPLCLGTPTPL